MLTPQELLQAVLLPVVVSALVAAIGWWRRWAWAMPVAAGAGFLTGVAAAHGLPTLPPADGSDWLFWVAIPLALVAIADALFHHKWGWLTGLLAGGVVAIVLKPLTPTAIPASTLLATATLFAIGGALLARVSQAVEPRTGPAAVAASLCITLGAAGVTVFSSGFRVMGIYGIAAAAALGPVAALTYRTPASRALTIFAAGLLAGLLTAGHFYADPGIPWPKATALFLAPLLMLAGAVIPTKRTWPRAVAALLAVTIAAAAITAPTALAAKKAAESTDPYAEYYK